VPDSVTPEVPTKSSGWQPRQATHRATHRFRLRANITPRVGSSNNQQVAVAHHHFATRLSVDSHRSACGDRLQGRRFHTKPFVNFSTSLTSRFLSDDPKLLKWSMWRATHCRGWTFQDKPCPLAVSGKQGDPSSHRLIDFGRGSIFGLDENATVARGSSPKMAVATSVLPAPPDRPCQRFHCGAIE